MSVTPLRLNGWRGPACDSACLPLAHNPEAHERYGYASAIASLAERTVATGCLTVDLKRRDVRVNGEIISLPSREWELLAFFARRVGMPCTNDTICTAIWGVADKASLRAMTMTLYRLRGRLGPARALITTYAAGPRTWRRLEYVEATP